MMKLAWKPGSSFISNCKVILRWNKRCDVHPINFTPFLCLSKSNYVTNWIFFLFGLETRSYILYFIPVVDSFLKIYLQDNLITYWVTKTCKRDFEVSTFIGGPWEFLVHTVFFWISFIKTWKQRWVTQIQFNNPSYWYYFLVSLLITRGKLFFLR